MTAIAISAALVLVALIARDVVLRVSARKRDISALWAECAAVEKQAVVLVQQEQERRVQFIARWESAMSKWDARLQAIEDGAEGTAGLPVKVDALADFATSISRDIETLKSNKRMERMP